MVGLMVLASCSGVTTLDVVQPATVAELATALESSPCGGGGLWPMSDDDVLVARQGFERWPLPPVFVSTQPLGDDAVGCFDGNAVLIHEPYMNEWVILAHEFCHAIAYLNNRSTPLNFPSPVPDSPRARALQPSIWHQEIWAVTCATAVTGSQDWSWGQLIDDSTDEAARWAAAYVAAGPSEPVDVPTNWSFSVVDTDDAALG
jgi:hypothetical protein